MRESAPGAEREGVRMKGNFGLINIINYTIDLYRQSWVKKPYITFNPQVNNFSSLNKEFPAIKRVT